MWSAIAAAILGVLVAAATSGQAPSVPLIVALVGLPLVVTIVYRLRGSRRAHRSPRPHHSVVRSNRARVRSNSARPPKDPRVSFRSPRPVASSATSGELDWVAIGSICVALDVRDLEWLRTNDFATPWLDSRARHAIELEPLVVATVDQPFEWGLRSALQVLLGAIEPFVAFYNEHTAPDPLLLGEDWRFFEREEVAIAAALGTGDDLWGGRAIHLHELAGQVADAHANVVSVATKDARVKRQIALPIRGFA